MKTVEELVKTMTPMQLEKLLEIVIDFHWMARRYADGRMSYATSLFNDHTRALQSMDIPLNETSDGTLFAQDGMGRRFDLLEDSHARLAAISHAEQTLTREFHLYRLFLTAEAALDGVVPAALLHAYRQWLKATTGEHHE